MSSSISFDICDISSVLLEDCELSLAIPLPELPPPSIVKDELYPWITISVEYLSWPDCSSFHFLVVICPSTYIWAPFLNIAEQRLPVPH